MNNDRKRTPTVTYDGVCRHNGHGRRSVSDSGAVHSVSLRARFVPVVCRFASLHPSSRKSTSRKVAAGTRSEANSTPVGHLPHTHKQVSSRLCAHTGSDAYTLYLRSLAAHRCAACWCSTVKTAISRHCQLVCQPDTGRVQVKGRVQAAQSPP